MTPWLKARMCTAYSAERVWCAMNDFRGARPRVAGWTLRGRRRLAGTVHTQTRIKSELLQHLTEVPEERRLLFSIYTKFSMKDTSLYTMQLGSDLV